MPVTIDLSRDALFTDYSIKRLKSSYMRNDEKSPQERFAFVAEAFSSNPEHAQRLYDYASKHWLSFSTPVLAYGRTAGSLPISCYLPYVDDTKESLVTNMEETSWLSMLGGGVGMGWGTRSASEKSTGVMPHLKIYDAMTIAFRQGSTRKASFAAYLDISHPDIVPFLEMRKPTGDHNIRCMNLHHAVNVPDAFMNIIKNCMVDNNFDDSWPLIDPGTKKITEVVSAKYLWQKIIELRIQTGEPYIHFIDTSNNAMPEFLKKKGLSIRQSNLCTEILLPTNGQRTAVCCLSSLNLARWYEYHKILPQIMDDVLEMLDNVLNTFIKEAPDVIQRAVWSASQERSVGLGAMGFHALLQSRMIPFESAMAASLNNQIWKAMHKEAERVNLRLGKERGEAPDAVGTGKRFSHMFALAPNATSAIILGNTSSSAEPFRANAYRQDTLSGININKNPYLDELIKLKCEENSKLSYDDIWLDIITNSGSIQHLDFFNDDEKKVYKTAMEIDQMWIIEHAAHRQKYIDQGQSVNLFFAPNANIATIHAAHYAAWKKGLKTLYYCRSESVGKIGKIEKKRVHIEETVVDMKELVEGDSCVACEG